MVFARRPKSCLFRLQTLLYTQRFPLAARDRTSPTNTQMRQTHATSYLYHPFVYILVCYDYYFEVVFDSFTSTLINCRWWSCPAVKARAHSSSRPFQFDVCRNVTAKSKNSGKKKEKMLYQLCCAGNSGWSEKVKCITRYTWRSCQKLRVQFKSTILATSLLPSNDIPMFLEYVL